jgi:pilus assembly protein CpaF
VTTSPKPPENLDWDFTPPDFSGEAFDPFTDTGSGVGGELGQGPVSVGESKGGGLFGTSIGAPVASPASRPRPTHLAQFNVEDVFGHTLEMLRDAAFGANGRFAPSELESIPDEVVAWCREKAALLIRDLNDRSWEARSRPAFEQPVDEVVSKLIDHLLGLGPLEEILRMAEVEDIAINGPDDVWYKARGNWVRVAHAFRNSQEALVMLNRTIVHSGRQAGPLTPIVDGTMRQGHRINIITSPLTDPWPVASIRVHRDHSLGMEDLVARGGEDRTAVAAPLLPDYFAQDHGTGMFSALSATFLHMAVYAGLNILVVGPTGVGKTTVLGALGRMIPSDRRIIVIEDTRELRMRGLKNADNCVYLLTRPATLEGLPAITQRDLVITALRQRPDALTIGEARGAEVFDMLKALWTGHRNGLTSVHADSIADVSSRIRMMLQEASFQTEVTEQTVAMWIARAFQLGMTLRRSQSGRRYVEEIVEFTGGIEGALPVTTPLFRYDPSRRRLICTGQRLVRQNEAQLREAGFGYDLIVQAGRERGELG